MPFRLYPFSLLQYAQSIFFLSKATKRWSEAVNQNKQYNRDRKKYMKHSGLQITTQRKKRISNMNLTDPGVTLDAPAH
jgi:uncharacterized membrane protein YbaN (DUF454 family)